jgi:ribosome-binding protein aMBF1 (putative translation factor)
MVIMSTIEEKLRKHAPTTPSKWREKAEWRKQNKSWLRYSQLVAIRMLDQMAAEGLTQKGLAERLGCSQQYVSKILKGTENMSLDTLTKLEDALDINLILPEEQMAYSDATLEEAFA